MPLYCQSDDISLTIFKKDLTDYSWDLFRADSFSAINVALLTVPQAMAYALLAGLPLTCGLFAAIYSSLIAAFFGSSRHLVVGPSNAIAVLVQTGVSEVLFTNYRDLVGPAKDLMAINILTQLCLLIGIFQLVAASFKLGRLTQFVSHSVVVAYICGTALAVIVNQMFTFLGIPRMQGIHSLYEKGSFLLLHPQNVHIPTLLIGVFSLTVLVILKRLNKKIPAAVIMLAFAGLLTYLLEPLFQHFQIASFAPHLEQTHTVMLIEDSGIIPDALPNFEFPYFDMGIMNTLLPVAFATALLSIMETTSVAKTIAAKSGQRLSNNQEILGVGFGNLMSSLVGGMPVSGSPSRSGLIYSGGGQTRFAAVMNALFVALIVVAFSYFVNRIPLAALAALLFVIAAGIVNIPQVLLCVKATSADAFVFWATLLACIFFNFDIAFYIGVIISITSYLKKAALPHLIEFDIDEEGELRSTHCAVKENRKPIRIIKVEGELFFGAADIFQSTLKTLAEDDTTTKVIVLQLKNTRDIDATTCLALQHLSNYLQGSGRHLILCGMTSQIWDVLSASGNVEYLGRENLFIFDERNPHHYLQKALARAKELASQTILSGDKPKNSELVSIEVVS